jgi:sulfoxide reductase catalytic subunit YedY
MPEPLRYSDVTPKSVYLNRRRFLGALAAPLAACAATLNDVRQGGPLHNLGNETPAPREIVGNYNNFYEFGTGKNDPARFARDWKPDPSWPLRLEGEVARPKTLNLDQVVKLAPLEERIYRLRCVEGWSYVVPWIGFPLSVLLNQVERTGKAKYVAFES